MGLRGSWCDAFCTPSACRFGADSQSERCRHHTLGADSQDMAGRLCSHRLALRCLSHLTLLCAAGGLPGLPSGAYQPQAVDARVICLLGNPALAAAWCERESPACAGTQARRRFERPCKVGRCPLLTLQDGCFTECLDSCSVAREWRTPFGAELMERLVARLRMRSPLACVSF